MFDMIEFIEKKNEGEAFRGPIKDKSLVCMWHAMKDDEKGKGQELDKCQRVVNHRSKVLIQVCMNLHCPIN
jgi:hypothetical protein